MSANDPSRARVCLFAVEVRAARVSSGVDISLRLGEALGRAWTIPSPKPTPRIYPTPLSCACQAWFVCCAEKRNRGGLASKGDVRRRDKTDPSTACLRPLPCTRTPTQPLSQPHTHTRIHTRTHAHPHTNHQHPHPPTDLHTRTHRCAALRRRSTLW